MNTDAVKIAELRQDIIDLLPDKGVDIFNEYNELISKLVEKQQELNNEQDKMLKSLANRSDN